MGGGPMPGPELGCWLPAPSPAASSLRIHKLKCKMVLLLPQFWNFWKCIQRATTTWECLKPWNPAPPTPPLPPSPVLVCQAVIFTGADGAGASGHMARGRRAPLALFAVRALSPGCLSRDRMPGRGPQHPAPQAHALSPRSDLLLGHVPAGGARLSALPGCHAVPARPQGVPGEPLPPPAPSSVLRPQAPPLLAANAPFSGLGKLVSALHGPARGRCWM